MSNFQIVGPVDGFVKAQRDNLDQIKRIPCYKNLVGALDAVYRVIIGTLPPDGFPAFFGRVVLVCHKSMLSASSLVAQGQPEDSVATTRRAVEAARVALAIKLNDENAAEWISYQERHDRWLKRQQNEKPKPFSPKYKDLKGDPVIDKLDKQIGIMSDAAVHFTPEFYSTLDWEVRQTAEDKGEIYLNYFQRDARTVEHHFISLGAAHVNILEALDRCYDGRIYREELTRSAVDTFLRVGRELNEVYHREYADPE